MRKIHILPAWGRILSGYRPLLSIEITKECPLRCPGCYAYEPEHLNNNLLLRQLSDLRGEQLVDGVLSVVRKYRPLHLSIVGGEPLVRFRELDVLLPKLGTRRLEVQLVTSAVRPIPKEWAAMRHVHLVVSIDGLQPEHDRRRTPATYSRILEHIAGHEIIVHCTVTRQMVSRPGYLSEFAKFWSDRPEVRKIWFSLFTPQHGHILEERLGAAERVQVVSDIRAIRREFPKIDMSDAVLNGFLRPPSSPEQCIFAQATTCLSADLSSPVTPCQFGGNPVCTECGCIASAGLSSVGNFRLAGVVPLADIFAASRRIGKLVRSGNREMRPAEA